jgi:transcriptional regulator with XRE-family HTH domain
MEDKLNFELTGNGSAELFASILRTLCAVKSMSLAALAETSGVERTVLSQMETGAVVPSEDQCKRLADALGVPDAYLTKARMISIEEGDRLRNPQIVPHLRTVFSANMPMDVTTDSLTGVLAEAVSARNVPKTTVGQQSKKTDPKPAPAKVAPPPKTDAADASTGHPRKSAHGRR